MLDKLPATSKVTNAQIMASKVALDAARRMGDPLMIDLAVATLNDLLDRYSYHTHHGSKQES